jgi:hypothetical protein
MKASEKNCIVWYCLQFCLLFNVLHFLWSTAALRSSNSFNIVMYFHPCLKTPGSFLDCLTEIGLVDELRLCFKGESFFSKECGIVPQSHGNMTVVYP